VLELTAAAPSGGGGGLGGLLPEQIGQSAAIARFLARRHGLAATGRDDDDVETAQLDALADFFDEFLAEIRKWFRVVTGREHGSKVRQTDKLSVARCEFGFRINCGILVSSSASQVVGINGFGF